MILQFISCGTCRADRLVGIDGHDLNVATHEDGVLDGVPYLSFDDTALESAPLLCNRVPCPVCGGLCDVHEAFREEG
jgi:hypothetical protein